MDADQAASIRQLTRQRENDILLYQEQKVRYGTDGLPMKDADGKVIEVKPFILAMMTRFQREAALKYGNNGPLILDSTFGTNSLGVSVAGVAGGGSWRKFEFMN